jgi:hypothetical protein
LSTALVQYEVETYYIAQGLILPDYPNHQVGHVVLESKRRLNLLTCQSLTCRTHWAPWPWTHCPAQPAASPATRTCCHQHYKDALLVTTLQQYWIGLITSVNSWPNFEWLDTTIAAIPFVAAPPPPPPATVNPSQPVLPLTTFANWGVMTFEAGNTTTLAEPNNYASPPELCVACNYSQLSNRTWPWADNNCGMQLPFICRIARKWPTAAGLRLMLCCSRVPIKHVSAA